MEFIETNFIWLLLIATIIFIYLYKRVTKNPNAITSKYSAKKTIKGNPSDNVRLIKEALKNAGFKKV